MRDQRPHLVEIGRRAARDSIVRRRAFIQLTLPRTVLISPLWAMKRYGCASFQRREGVGREALVHQRQRRLRQRIAQVVVEAADLRAPAAGPCRPPCGVEKRRHVELGQARQARASRPAPRAGSASACGSSAACARTRPGPRSFGPRADDRLADHRHRRRCTALPRPVGVGRHVAPAEQRLAFDLAMKCSNCSIAKSRAGFVLRQEAHGDGIVARRRQRQALRLPPSRAAARRASGSGCRRRRPPAGRRRPRRDGRG